MKFMNMVKSSENAGPPPPRLMDAIGQLAGEAAKAGVGIEMGGLLPSALGSRIRVSKGKLIVTDGPFTEAKELVGGYAVFNVKSKAEALEFASRFMKLHLEHWPEWEGESELRQVFDPADSAR